MKIIAVCNQKGGVAKTTTAINIAASLGVLGKKSLLIDLDPQGNATMACGVNKKKVDQSMLDICLENKELKDIIIKTNFKNLLLAPSNQDLTVAEVQMRNKEQSPFILKDAIKAYEKTEKINFIIIDCPPALNILTVNAMIAAQYVLVPIQCEYYALEGVTALLDTMGDIKKTVNRKLEILGFLRTMYDKRSNLSLDVSNQLIEFFGDKLFETIIPRNVRLAEAPSHGQPIYYYDKSSKGARAYYELSLELVKRLKKS